MADDTLARAERGDAQAQFRLGRSFYLGFGVGQDDSEALRWFRQAASQNHPRALFELGMMHMRGHGVLEDREKAHGLLLKSAELGDSEAMNALGSFYWRGAFGAPNIEAAAEWFRKSAETDDCDGMFYLGQTFEHHGDFETAAAWYRHAMKWHQPEATCRIAHFLTEGKGEPQDIEQAIKLLEHAGGEYQYPLAHFWLAELYDKGLHVAQDYREAAGYYFLAADEGVASAQLRYAELAELGHGGTDDPHEAYVWGRVALEHLSDADEVERGQALLARIKSTYGPWQLTEAEKNAKRAIAFLRQDGHC